MNDDAREQRIAALTRLALATREIPPIRTAEDKRAWKAYLTIYLEDTAGFSTSVVVQACRRLETTCSWFPKVAELLEACRAIALRAQEQREQDRARLIEGPRMTPEQFEDIKARIRKAIGRQPW